MQTELLQHIYVFKGLLLLLTGHYYLALHSMLTVKNLTYVYYSGYTISTYLCFYRYTNISYRVLRVYVIQYTYCK